MSISELGALGEFLGFFAVLATLIYLAIQTRQTRQIAASEAGRNVVVDFQNLWASLGEDAERTRIIRRAVNDWHSLSANEQMLAHAFLSNLIAHLSSAIELEGRLPELKSLIIGWEDNILGLLQCEGGKAWYESCQYLFLPSLQERVRERLDEPESLPPAWTDVMDWWRLDAAEREHR